MATARDWACGAITVLAMVPAVFAQSMREDVRGARFGVSGYAAEGQALLRADDFSRIIASFAGRQESAADVERAPDALQQAYQALGHCSVADVLSHPVSPDGVATFRAAELPIHEQRECLPIVALDDQGNPAIPRSRDVAEGVSPKAAIRDSPLPRSATIAAKRPNGIGSESGMVTAAYVEGSGGSRLTLWLDRHGFDDERTPNGGIGAREITENMHGRVTLAESDAVSRAPAAAAPVALKAKSSLPMPSTSWAQVEAARPEDSPASRRPAVQVAQAPPAIVPPAEIVPLAPIAAPKFEIRRYVVEGNTLLKPERLDRVLAPFAGKNKDFGDVQRALEALQGAYQEDGYGSVEIRLPEQEIEHGEVRFVAVEAKIGKITVEGNEHFANSNIRRSVPGLREGVTPNSHDIAQSIRLANENPAKQSTVLLKGAEREGQIDATIRVADIKPSRYSVSFDNTGNENTGRMRMGLAYQHANLFDSDHVLTAQFLTAPANFHKVSVYGVGYRIPLYSLGDSIDLVAGLSDVDSGTVQDLFNVTGKGAVYALRYNHGLTKWGDVEHKLTVGLDYRAYQNNVKPVGGNANLVPDITVHPVSVTYVASLRQEQRELSVFLSFVQNLPGMNDGTDDIFKNARFQVGTAGYRLFRFGGSYSRAILGDWQARIRLDAQYTDDTLVTGEQFAIGGADNVRGFSERFTSNDKGYRTNWEISTPNWAKQLGLTNGRLRFLAFYDTGVTYRNQPLPGELEAASLDSVGLGIRFSHKNYFTTRFDVAHVLHDGTQGPQSLERDGKRNITKIHFSAGWVW